MAGKGHVLTPTDAVIMGNKKMSVKKRWFRQQGENILCPLDESRKLHNNLGRQGQRFTPPPCEHFFP